MLLDDLNGPEDLKRLAAAQLPELAREIRDVIVDAVATNGGHLGSNLGAVELSIALHRVFESPTDAILWDTGHQAYVHKLLTGRKSQFNDLRRADGLSGYPSREESRHDFVENSHASTILSYAYGLAVGRDAGTTDHRHIVAVIGDGAMTGGMSFEALNNLGHSKRRVIIVLNDNGRSYAPTVSNLWANAQQEDERSNHPSFTDRITSTLSNALTDIRMNPVYVRRQRKIERFLHELPGIGNQAERALDAFKAGVREFLQPPAFFEALGVRYTGPIDGHDMEALENALQQAEQLSEEGPIVVHVLTQKGRGYAPAESDDEKHLHDAPIFDPLSGPPPSGPTGYTEAFSRTMLDIAERDDRIVGITAAMAGPTGLLPMQERFPDRVFDVGIAEQHAVTGAAGMAMAGLRPVVAVYSTFLSRAWDQVVYDVALHRLPVIFCLDRAGITGPDGASHHGVYDLALLSKVPGMRVLAPSNADELEQMLSDAVALADDGPLVIRYPRGGAPRAADGVGSGLHARKVVTPTEPASVAICAIGRMVATAETAAGKLAADGINCTVWDVRSCVPLDPAMLDDAGQHQVVITIEDGIVEGGIGSMLTRSLSDRQSSTSDDQPQIINLGLPTVFIPHGAPDDLFEKFDLDADNVVSRIRSALG